jgi:hypothetical protein
MHDLMVSGVNLAGEDARKLLRHTPTFNSIKLQNGCMSSKAGPDGWYTLLLAPVDQVCQTRPKRFID